MQRTTNHQRSYLSTQRNEHMSRHMTPISPLSYQQTKGDYENYIQCLTCRVVRCWTCDREVTGAIPALGCCVPTPTQRAIPQGSVNQYQQKLGSKRAYHAMHRPRIRGLVASAGVRLRAKETEISAAPMPHGP